MPTLVLSNYWRSSCSHRVRIALGYKNLSYDSVFINLLEGKQRTPEYRRENPIGHVPTLSIDGVRYVESVAILELLEELYPDPPLLPKTPHARARVRELVETVNAGIQPLQNLSVLDRVGDAKTEQEKRLSWVRHFIARGLAAYEALVARGESERGGDAGPFSSGASFSMADACLIPQVHAARRMGVDLTAYPRIVRIDAAASDLAFVARAKPEAQPDAAT